MNKKTILNRTLPLIIALVVILVVAVSVTIFSGAKKTPGIATADSEYLSADLGNSNLGYSQKVSISNQEIYDRLKNGENGLKFLVDMLDEKLLTEEGFINDVKDEDIKKAIEEEIFGKDYEFDGENKDADDKKIKDFIQKMKITYGIEVKKDSIAIDDSKLTVNLNGNDTLTRYYKIVLARKAYTIDKMGQDQEKAYKEFIDKYEEYLEELHKFNEEEISKAPTAPTEGSTVTSSNVQADYEKDNSDSYWTLFVTYETKEEAEKALLQVGVVIYNSTWYKFEGDIKLRDENGKKLYDSLSDYYKQKGTKLGQFEITEKLVELYNNSKVTKPSEKLTEGVQFNKFEKTFAEWKALEKKEQKNYQVFNLTEEELGKLSDSDKTKYLNEITKSEWEKLDDEEQKAFTEKGENYVAYQKAKALVFNTELVKDAEGKVTDDPKNALYFTTEELTKVDSSIHSYIKSLTSAYDEEGTWNKAYTKSIQAKGAYYILGVKLDAIKVDTFEDKFGTMYDKDKFEENGLTEDMIIGYVKYTVKDGEKEFDFANSEYWTIVNKLVKNAATPEKINEYMSKLRNEKGLIIYDEKIEAAYMAAYKSDYKATKKSSSTVIAKLAWKDADGKKQTFEVTADQLFENLEKVFGAITATDAFQYQNVLFQNEIIDYAKYLETGNLKGSVLITEYALAKKGSTEAFTAWRKANTDGEVVFDKVSETGEFDVLVRKYTTKKEKANAVVKSEFEAVADKENANKYVVTVSDEPDYLDSEGKFATLDDQIAALKLYFTNGNFAEYGYDASYGWKNFLRDYFQQFYGIKVETNDDLKLYYIYEDAVKNITEDLANTTEENWQQVYLPFMQKEYDKFFSVDAVHFLIYVEDEDGKMIDPIKDADKWTADQTKAAKDLYAKVYEILKKTKKADQAKVLQDIVDAIASAPKFVDGVALNSKAQKEAVEANKLFEETNDKGVVTGHAIEFTTTIKGVELETSLYKTFGIKAKYEDLGTVTADKMVKNFEDALKLMWNKQNNNGDNGMAAGTSLETNDLYADYAGNDEYLMTEFGYHVLVANKFTGRPTEKKDKEPTPVKLPTLGIVEIYEKDGKEVDDLTDYEMAQIKTYYEPIHKEFESSQYYQLKVMENIVKLLSATDAKVKFANAANKDKAIEISNYYIESYYKNLKYVGTGYDQALELMKLATAALNGLANKNDNITKENMDAILVVVENALTGMNHTEGKLPEADFNKTQRDDFEEAYKNFVAAKATYTK